MRSLASASKLLSRCTSVDSAAFLLRELGFLSIPVPLTLDASTSLRFPEEISDVRVSSGEGAARAIVFEIRDKADLRQVMARVASSLISHSAALLYLLVAIDKATRRTAIAAIDGGPTKPRIAALVVSIDQVVDSDAETLCAMAAAKSSSTVLTYSRWVDILGRESINRRFFKDLDRTVANLAVSVAGSVNLETGKELSLICVSRLLFLSFLETRGWLDRDHGFLVNRFAACMATGGSYHRRVLNPLFFGTLNTTPSKRAKLAREFGRVPFLNGGLFARSSIETQRTGTFFSDESLGDVFGDLLTRYRFTAREDGNSWSEAAIDPEMLGKAFESLMGSSDRKKSGAFYTPQSLVREVCHSALTYGLESPNLPPDAVRAAIEGTIPAPSHRDAMRRSIDGIRLLDPACGSGAFLVFALEELAALSVRLGDLRAPHAIRRSILTRSIFGVDINPTAVWLCELRLWLAMAIEDPESDPMRVTPLPNLDRNIRIGDSLAGDGFSDRHRRIEGKRISAMRARYVRATGPRKRNLAKTLDRFERSCALATLHRRLASLIHDRVEILVLMRSPDLFGRRQFMTAEYRERLDALRREVRVVRVESRRLENGGALPFSFSSGFADASADGGFDIVVGNPPWIRTGNLDQLQRASMRERYQVYRNAAWSGGASAAAAGKGFASQVDAAALFVERSTQLLRPGGCLSLILPVKLWRSLAGGGVRDLLLNETSLREIDDMTIAPRSFDAAVYPSVITASRTKVNEPCVSVASHRGDAVRRWCTPASRISYDDSRGSPWVLVPEEVRAAFDAMSLSGVNLSSSAFGRPLLGVKTGCNAAFVLQNPLDIESSLLRPVIRGDQVRPWHIDAARDRILWTHDDAGPVERLPPNAARWLSQWRRDLEKRTDGRGRHRWWMLFRTESASYSRPRVVWADIGKTPRASVIDAGNNAVPLNSCYVVYAKDQIDAHALCALLNSKLAASWLALLAEPASGGYFRFMGWTMSLLPLPRDWSRARRILAPTGESARSGSLPSDDELLCACLRAYELDAGQVAPMLQWNAY